MRPVKKHHTSLLQITISQDVKKNKQHIKQDRNAVRAHNTPETKEIRRDESKTTPNQTR